MFFHNFKYSLKILIRNKALLFWTFLFPLVLGLFFKMAFSNIEKQETFKVIDIAIVDNEVFRNDLVYKEVFKDLGNKNSNNYMFNIKYLNELDARKLLDEKKISAYIDFNKEDLVVNQSGVNETIVLNVINKINTNKKIINDLIQENNYLEINNLLASDIKLENTSSNNLSYTMIEYYTLLAMACLYGAIISLTVTNSRLANMTSEGKRISISPINKKAMLLGSFLASYIVQIIGVLLLFIYTVFVLGVDYGSNWGLVLLLIAVGSLAGLSLGVFIATFFKFSENTKTGVLISVVMAWCFLSGMMGITMKYIIDKNVPILNLINPANMITDGFYALYYYNTLNRYYFNIISLLIFSILMLLISYYKLRRQRYDSI